MSTNTIDTLRATLFAQLAELRAAGPEALKDAIARSRAVSELGAVLIDSARVEVDYLRLVDDAQATGFLEAAPGALPPGITGIVQHRLAR